MTKKTKSKSEELDDLLAGEKEATAAPAKTKGKGGKKAAAPEPELEEQTASAEEQAEEAPAAEDPEAAAPESEEQVTNEEEQTEGQPVESAFPVTYDLDPGTVLRIPENYSQRLCQTCRSKYVAPDSWKFKRCPPCVKPPASETQAAAAEEPQGAQVQGALIPLNPLEQFSKMIEEGGGVLERVLAAGNYSSAFGLHGSIELKITDGKIVGTSKFKEPVVSMEDLLGTPPPAPEETTGTTGEEDR